jgi:hypothetical protein
MIRQQVIILKDIAEILISLCLCPRSAIAIICQMICGNGASIKGVQASYGIEKAGLAAAGRAYDADKACIRQSKADVMEDSVGMTAMTIIGFI